MFMDVRMCECIVCMKEKANKVKRVASGHQTFKKKKRKLGLRPLISFSGNI
jgi:hypothetical protein